MWFRAWGFRGLKKGFRVQVVVHDPSLPSHLGQNLGHLALRVEGFRV